ncbi:MAG: hypothetical protein R3183_05125 [Oleiphilaceae bacterium]|nr:hypothetical protein [Oleiphilaceae bacterium]
MHSKPEVLIIGTYGIDIFHGVIEQIEDRGYLVYTADARNVAQEFLRNRQFDAILINLEPDGKGDVAELDLLQSIGAAPLQQQAICMGVSVEYPKTLTGDKVEKHLKILAGWLTMPIKPAALAEHLFYLLATRQKHAIGALQNG